MSIPATATPARHCSTDVHPSDPTLAAWCDKVGVVPIHPTTERGAVSVCIDPSHPDRPEAFRLRDYRVSSSSGVVLWFLPRLSGAMPSGYCYVLPAGERRGWDELSECEVYTPTGDEVRQAPNVGIDGSQCAVFTCPDGRVRAVMAHCVIPMPARVPQGWCSTGWEALGAAE